VTTISLEMRCRITSEARLELWFDEVVVPKPAAGELVVRVDAAPLNPSDIILLLGPVDPATIQAGGTPTRPTASASVPLERMSGPEAIARSRALVHTAAASNLGQMLNRVCLTDGIRW
jgi:hypothetical protein